MERRFGQLQIVVDTEVFTDAEKASGDENIADVVGAASGDLIDKDLRRFVESMGIHNVSFGAVNARFVDEDEV